MHSYGGIVLHDVINDRFARKAIEKGADGLIPVAAGAGGHAGQLSPFALIQELRDWFDGPIALSGAIADGPRGAGARRRWARTSPISARPSSRRRRPTPPQAYKEMIVASGGEDIVYTNLFTGVHGNYLRPSIDRARASIPTTCPSPIRRR